MHPHRVIDDGPELTGCQMTTGCRLACLQQTTSMYDKMGHIDRSRAFSIDGLLLLVLARTESAASS
jgi:hypothetical protein